MELGRSKGNNSYLVEELAAKQPLSIAFLRQYLIPSTSIARPLSSKDNSPSRMKTDTSRGDTLSVLAAQYTNIPENFDVSDHKPILC